MDYVWTYVCVYVCINFLHARMRIYNIHVCMYRLMCKYLRACECTHQQMYMRTPYLHIQKLRSQHTQADSVENQLLAHLYGHALQ